MMRSTTILALLALSLAAGVPGLPMPATAGPALKVEICHVPPGNPTNFHTILVGETALPAHLAHGDLPGACGAHCESLCDDGDACTIDACDASEQCVHAAADCNDGNTCTADSCDPGSGCVNAPRAGEACVVVDEDPCTTGDGTCHATGACVPVLVPGCCNTDVDCEADKNPCTEQPQCVDNVCRQDPVDCSTDDPCLVGYCDPFGGGCQVSEPLCKQQPCHVTSCDPTSGECVATPIDGCCVGDEDCDDGNACTVDICSNQSCVYEDAHRVPDQCHVWVSSDGACVLQEIACDDGDACTADQCLAEEGCVSTPLPPSPTPESNCRDGLDDDCDGAVDGDDSDCDLPSCDTARTDALAACASSYDACAANAGTALELQKCADQRERCEQCAEQDYAECLGNPNPFPDPIDCSLPFP